MEFSLVSYRNKYRDGLSMLGTCKVTAYREHLHKKRKLNQTTYCETIKQIKGLELYTRIGTMKRWERVDKLQHSVDEFCLPCTYNMAECLTGCPTPLFISHMYIPSSAFLTWLRWSPPGSSSVLFEGIVPPDLCHVT
jgi:hypothetical protein